MKSKMVILDMSKPENLTNDQVIFAHHFENLNNGIIDCVEQLMTSPSKEASSDVVIDSFCHQLVMMTAYIAIFYKRTNKEYINKYMNEVSKTSIKETLKIFKEKEGN